MAPCRAKRRREKGTGSVTFDKSRNKWVARMPDTGIGSSPKKQFDTEDEAHTWLDQKRRKVLQRKTSPRLPSGLTIVIKTFGV
jgi:hypothetical protein